MTEADYAAARSVVLAGGDPPSMLLADCRRSVGLLVSNAGLPAHYSPYGVWNREAVDEVFSDWIAVRAVGRGQLRAILQRAPALKVFRRMVETSVRQHLIDGLKPSQAANLYERTVELLSSGDFGSRGSGTGKLWHLADGPFDPFDGDDRQLLAVAWSLGAFEVIRYDLEARKLSPLLSADDLERFVVGMLSAGSMTAATVVRAVKLRFALDDDQPSGDLEDALHVIAAPEPQSAPVIAELVTATLAELSQRQARVLMGTSKEVPGRELAARLGCSTGTISNELRQIREILTRLGADAPYVLKEVLDRLFQDDV